ncbi:hypothetical protein RSAG8_12469, partial [Rhizoctonia solani AG-8 WAC10335]
MTSVCSRAQFDAYS